MLSRRAHSRSAYRRAVVSIVCSLLAIALTTCRRTPDPDTAADGQSAAKDGHLQVRGTWFYRSNGTRFEWRGITAFRLLEKLAAGKTSEVESYLAWAAQHRISVVRVLAMARGLFQLPPQIGRQHLEDLFQRTARHRIHVEIVALADTAQYDESVDSQVREVGRIAEKHTNALVEIANEPYHATQVARVQDLASLRALVPLVPEVVPVALGAGERPADYAAGDYVTAHFSRSSDAARWGHVRDLTDARRILEAVGKPLVSDEPIGAAPEFQSGRRDDDPERFRAAALLTRMMGVAATFHYENGLHANIPERRERECFDAWSEAWTLLPNDIETSGTFRAAGAPGVAAVLSNPRSGEWVGVWEVQRASDVWVLVAGAGAAAAELSWTEGWRQVGERRWSASRLIRGAR